MKIPMFFLAVLPFLAGLFQENPHAMSTLTIVFTDPVVTLTSREAVKKYYSNQYQNFISIKFDFESLQSSGDEQMLVYPRDYFDMGVLITKTSRFWEAS